MQFLIGLSYEIELNKKNSYVYIGIIILGLFGKLQHWFIDTMIQINALMKYQIHLPPDFILCFFLHDFQNNRFFKNKNC